MSGLQFSSRERNIFLVFLLVCVVYGIYSGFYRPALAKRRQIEAQIVRTRRELMEQERIIRRARGLGARFQKDLESFRQTVPNEQVMSVILSDIEATVKGLEVRIREMKPEETRKEDFYNIFAVRLTMEGDLVGIMQFIHALQSSSPRFMISEYTLMKSIQSPNVILAKLVVNRILIP